MRRRMRMRMKIKLKMKNLKKKKQFKDANMKKLIEEPKEIKSPNWFDKNKFKEILLTAINLVTNIKQVILNILILKTWLIILKIIQLVKQMLKNV